MATISVNDKVRIKVVFRDWNTDADNSDPVDPDTVMVSVIYEGDVLASYPKTYPHLPEFDRENVGKYFYDWAPDQAGVYSVRFEGVFANGQTTVIEEEFSVGVDGAGGATLREDQELVFATEVEPLLVDVEELISFFPEATYVEVMELVHRYSTEVIKMLNINVANAESEVSFLALEYIRAAVLCSLSRVHDIFGGDASSLSLGDLNVSNQKYPRNGINRANATTWCELAAILREELLRGEANIKAVIKGTRYTNPMPKRKLKSYYGGNGRQNF